MTYTNFHSALTQILILVMELNGVITNISVMILLFNIPNYLIQSLYIDAYINSIIDAVVLNQRWESVSVILEAFSENLSQLGDFFVIQIKTRLRASKTVYGKTCALCIS